MATEAATPARPGLSFLTFNIGGPALERAQRQLAWLAQRPEDVFVLTETTPGPGCAYLADRFRSAGYEVAYPVPDKGERGVMIVSRLRLAAHQPVTLDYLPYRAVSTAVHTTDGPLEILGLYVPSRDATAAKTERKARFIAECQDRTPEGTGTPRIVMGDLNILEPDHRPRYPIFRPFEYDYYRWFGKTGYHDAFRHVHPGAQEYSWVGRTNDGYRYDHAFVSTPLLGLVHSCAYVHEPRTEKNLTDHSGLTLRVDVTGDQHLTVSDPTSTPEPEPETTLF
ncbi:endonuclease/exonuclease/phosphatase family protein [Kitasatospora viridis]|uniref:Exodeoxyribonuclease-3 n=1 Tax=Kitasatospora viridis TaxID=281105 RepID=A0A561SA57_9ACTN|nr:endonuclease/exonuclease/phosphatase family protein [Kitasatospora viridis]TWF71758.1 exodeoxyribonuclease-3 [Kitasatospora viridis]